MARCNIVRLVVFQVPLLKCALPIHSRSRVAHIRHGVHQPSNKQANLQSHPLPLPKPQSLKKILLHGNWRAGTFVTLIAVQIQGRGAPSQVLVTGLHESGTTSMYFHSFNLYAQDASLRIHGWVLRRHFRYHWPDRSGRPSSL